MICFGRKWNIFQRYCLTFPSVALLAFVLDKLQTVRAVSSVKHQNLANLAILALSCRVGSSVVGYNISVGDFTVSAAPPPSVLSSPSLLRLLSPPSAFLCSLQLRPDASACSAPSSSGQGSAMRTDRLRLNLRDDQ